MYIFICKTAMRGGCFVSHVKHWKHLEHARTGEWLERRGSCPVWTAPHWSVEGDLLRSQGMTWAHCPCAPRVALCLRYGRTRAHCPCAPRAALCLRYGRTRAHCLCALRAALCVRYTGIRVQRSGDRASHTNVSGKT